MRNDAINIFRNLLDDSDNILKKIRIEVYEKLNLGGYEQFNEFVKESLEHFSFNISERNFFEQIRTVVNEEIAKDNLKIKNGETVDYDLFVSNLTNQLKKIGQVDINFDDDFRNLAKNINNKFPLIASDEWYARLNSKKEQIISMINKYNQDIVETLINLTPKLASELSAIESKARSNSNDNHTLQQPTHQKGEQQTLSTQQIVQSIDEQLKKIKKDDLVQEIINAMNRAGEMSWGDINFDERINRINNMRNRLYNKSIDDLQTILSTYQNEKKEEVPIQLTQKVDMGDDFQQSITEQEEKNLSMEIPNQVNSHLNDNDKSMDFTKIVKTMDEELDTLIQKKDAKGLKEFIFKHGGNLNDEQVESNKSVDISHSNVQTPIQQVNIPAIMTQIRHKILLKNKENISTIQSTNPFTKFKPITISQFQEELTKYGVDVDKSYIEDVIYQINFELERELINKAKTNILNNIIMTTGDSIDLLKIEDLIQKYKLNLDNEDMAEIIQYVNNGIIEENERRRKLNKNQNPILPNDPKPDNPSPSVSTYIGATNEDVQKLIRANKYYSLLHGINRESFMQYNGFIQTGFRLIASDYYSRAATCRTLEERLKALQELKEIYDNFNGYITMEQSDHLRALIEDLTNYLQQKQSQQMIDDIGIRYNGDNSREVNPGKHM